MAYVAGADIKRGDMIKLDEGELFPALLYEENVGAAAEAIPRGREAICSADASWRRVRPPKRSVA